ncbi:unnamed protein product [Spirodela intermedia]|uniref:Uncharacterized protein n=1 Tax=Spirodela intermedia TaxID=51605 RepID=A0A7I8JBX1_SPIIN|nr:unnamed protein product [Spirodela intermedia]CAA6667599.1 unnamed protein product [Spirodela intermedia]
MDTFRRHRISPPSERFLGLFSSPSGTLTGAGAGVELHEDEVFWAGTDFSASSSSSPQAAAAGDSKPAMRLSPSSPSSPRTFRGLAEKNFGILAALPAEERNQYLRKSSSLKPNPSSIASTSSSPSSSTTAAAAARMIPAVPKPKLADIPLLHQSAPVNVPVVPRRRLQQTDGGDDYEEDEMLPPHEMVAKKHTPATTFSVLEGAGRTLKGRDLRRVRNAVWRQTGFMD